MSMNHHIAPAHIHKIVISGTVGSGKTQAIKSLSEGQMVATEALSSQPQEDGKTNITVAMDYGVITLDSKEQVHLYGTPGHKRFDFMWDILSENASGLILLINAEEVDPIADLQDYVDSFKLLIDTTALIVGITHAENAAPDLQQRVSEHLQSINIEAEVMVVDAREREHIQKIVNSLVQTVAS